MGSALCAAEPLDSASMPPRIIVAMRMMMLLAMAVCAAGACAQQAMQLPAPQAATQPAEVSFRFVSDGPQGAGWSRSNEIARTYFHENLTALFERTLALREDVPARSTLRWIFTGPHAGFTVELTSTKVRISERYYDSMGLYDGEGNYPQKATMEVERQFIGHARTLTVVAGSHLAVSVLINGKQVLEAPLLFDVTRHQLMFAAPRTVHDVVEGELLKPLTQNASVILDPAKTYQTMLGFGGSPSIPAYDELSAQGKQEYWRMIKRYNLLLQREYPMGEELKPDMSNLADASQATPHYYGDNFPNSEVSSFSYNKRIVEMGGDVIYELWALPKWATEPYQGPKVVDIWNKEVKQVANSEKYAQIIVTYCRLEKARTGVAPLIVGIENEVDQPPSVFSAMALTLRRELDKAGFTQTKIHMADAGFMLNGIQRARELSKDAAAWKAIDYAATHEYDFQEFAANPDMYDARMREMHESTADKPFLATEICFNDAHYQELSYHIAFAAAQLYHKNLTELDAEALMYCWTLLDVEQPSFAGSRALMMPDRTKGWVPVPSSFQLRVMGAFSRHILKGMKRIDAASSDPDLLTTAFADGQKETLVMVNRAATAREVTVQGAGHTWVQMERTGLEEDNADSTVPGQITVQPGEIVVLSTIKAE